MRSYPLLKILTIADPAHVSDVMYVLRFIQVTKPIISYKHCALTSTQSMSFLCFEIQVTSNYLEQKDMSDRVFFKRYLNSRKVNLEYFNNWILLLETKLPEK